MEGPKCPSNRGMDKNGYTVEYHSAIKKDDAIRSNMDGPRIVMLSEVSQREEQYGMTSLICGIQKEMVQMNLQSGNRLSLREQTYACQGQGLGKETVREFGMDMYSIHIDGHTLLYLKWITNKHLLYSTGNSAQRYLVTWMGEEFRREWLHVYVRLSPFAEHLKLSQHC